MLGLSALRRFFLLIMTLAVTLAYSVPGQAATQQRVSADYIDKYLESCHANGKYMNKASGELISIKEEKKHNVNS